MVVARTDWTALRLEYVNSTVTLRALAEKHGIKAAGVMRRAAKEGWDDARKQESAEVSKASQAALTLNRAEELAKFNEDDLRVAKGIRAKAARMMGEAADPNSLRSLASAFEAAQRIGRLALGATTDNAGLSGPDGGPIPSMPTVIELVAKRDKSADRASAKAD